MKISRELMAKANIIPKLKLGAKDERGIPRSTGPHRVKIVSDELKNGKDKETGASIPVVRYIFEENEEKRSYEVPVKNKQGELHYLIQQLSEYGEGQELIMEMKKQGPKSYIAVSAVGNSKNIEVDEEDHDVEYEDEEVK